MALNRLIDASFHLVFRYAKPLELRTHQLALEPQAAIGVCEETELAN